MNKKVLTLGGLVVLVVCMVGSGLLFIASVGTRDAYQIGALGLSLCGVIACAVLACMSGRSRVSVLVLAAAVCASVVPFAMVFCTGSAGGVSGMSENKGVVSRSLLQDVEYHQLDGGTDTLLLAQRISHQFALALPNKCVSTVKEGWLNNVLLNYGFQMGSETKKLLPAADYFPRIAPEGGKAVWLWRAWNPNDGSDFLLIEVLPDGKRVQHSGVMQEIRDYGPCAVHEYTWEGHGIRVYAWKDHEWVDGMMSSFHEYFSTSEVGDEVAPE